MLIDHSNEQMMRLLVNTTRQAELKGAALAEAHRDVGRRLAGSVARHLILEDVEICHVTGISTGVRVKVGSEPIIVAVMRAGLFLAEGVWSSLSGSSLVLHSDRGSLDASPMEGRTVIVVDSVINTGRSIRDVLGVVEALQPASVAVVALVAYRTSLEVLVNEYPSVYFHIARISDRSYIGRGCTDTGARLFGTTTWSKEV
ncbi:uracil phosphoribosyltransferase [Pseudomonas capsici]|uniref:Uracil phosphoribosyltransferase n=1 Tax=Pseudomonas capsici TaxID=2810614 RepID=A0ABT3BSC9_9PSED|nr:uracil phosphoribosyltransferase [Pseudomonas capsici]MCV4268049.1 uracil phosphoribosyltransferase [Pseudomonas capsici]MCV4276874.1 uracil phosphoribosyltransferase [Pseudomonas capsici]MCV4330425.1 uracil phosphoribosyltransferase [Pseudomonas capsici]MCV4375721.1 uracil phosphoribosyltransferase [Pseudomonas capsici]